MVQSGTLLPWRSWRLCGKSPFSFSPRSREEALRLRKQIWITKTRKLERGNCAALRLLPEVLRLSFTTTARRPRRTRTFLVQSGTTLPLRHTVSFSPRSRGALRLRKQIWITKKRKLERGNCAACSFYLSLTCHYHYGTKDTTSEIHGTASLGILAALR